MDTAYNEIFNANDGVTSLAIGWRTATATGAEDDCTIATSASERGASSMWRIDGQSTVNVPEISSAGGATGSSANPDPDTNTPSSPSGAADFKWIAVYGQDGASTASAAPSGYGNLSTADGGGGPNNGCNVGTADLDNNAASEDPGTFTSNRNDSWIACTVAIHPGVDPIPAEVPQVFYPDLTVHRKRGNNAAGMTPGCHKEGEVISYRRAA